MHTDRFCRPEQPGTTYGQRLISADQLGTLCAEHQHTDIAYSCQNKRRFAHCAWTPNTCRVHSCTLKIASEKAQNYCSHSAFQRANTTAHLNSKHLTPCFALSYPRSSTSATFKVWIVHPHLEMCAKVRA